jgi:hypothetical protein
MCGAIELEPGAKKRVSTPKVYSRGSLRAVTAVGIASIVFVCTFGAALLGIWCRIRLPDHHLSSESKDVVRIGMGLVATMAALILGLVVASAKSAFDAQDSAVRSVAADVLALDRTLAQYGPETAPIRAAVRRAVEGRLQTSWTVGDASSTQDAWAASGESIEDLLLSLTPQNDAQRWLQSQALSSASDVLKTRWTAFASAGTSVPTSFLIVLVFWLAALFWSFGLFAPANPTVLSVLLLCAASVALAVFLILEMETPFAGLMKISSAPLHAALEQLGR